MIILNENRLNKWAYGGEYQRESGDDRSCKLIVTGVTLRIPPVTPRLVPGWLDSAR